MCFVVLFALTRKFFLFLFLFISFYQETHLFVFFMAEVKWKVKSQCSRGAQAKLESVKCKTERDENFCETENVYKSKKWKCFYDLVLCASLISHTLSRQIFPFPLFFVYLNIELQPNTKILLWNEDSIPERECVLLLRVEGCNEWKIVHTHKHTHTDSLKFTWGMKNIL